MCSNQGCYHNYSSFKVTVADNTVNTVLKCVYRYTEGDNVRDYIIFYLFHFDVELCQGNAKSTNGFGKFLLHYRKILNMFEVTYLDSR